MQAHPLPARPSKAGLVQGPRPSSPHGCHTLCLVKKPWPLLNTAAGCHSSAPLPSYILLKVCGREQCRTRKRGACSMQQGGFWPACSTGAVLHAAARCHDRWHCIGTEASTSVTRIPTTASICTALPLLQEPTKPIPAIMSRQAVVALLLLCLVASASATRRCVGRVSALKSACKKLCNSRTRRCTWVWGAALLAPPWPLLRC